MVLCLGLVIFKEIRMPIRRNPANDKQNPPGQWVNPMMKTLGEIIDATKRADALVLEPKTIPTEHDRGYAEGFIDGKAEGFREGLEWARGR